MTERDQLIAHESAHAAAAVALRYTPTAIEIRQDGGHVSVPIDFSDEDGARDLLLVALAGRIGHDEPGWPPAWPPSRTKSSDEHHAAILAEYLNLDSTGWRAICAQAWRLAAGRPFTRLERAFTDALQRTSHLDAKAIDALIGANMEHLTLKAVISPTDLGEFEAVISSEAVDREKDVVLASAMVDALSAWSREVPLAWEHSLQPNDVIGTIDPTSVHRVNGEVVASGQVDLDTERGAQAWRLMKAGSAAFSFGYMTTDAVKRADGVREVRKLDVFEISVVMAPMNNGTRVLATKAADTGDDAPLSHTELERQLVERGIIRRTVAATDQPHATNRDVAGAEREFMANLLANWRNGDDEHRDKTATTPQRADAPRTKSAGPIRVAEFTC